MAKLWRLVRLNLRAMLHSLQIGSGKSKKAGKVTGYGALLLLAALAVYIAGVYSFMFAALLGEVGMIDYLIPLMAILGCGLSVVMTIQAASGFIFSGKDSDLMLSLPVSAFSVMLSRITALYIENLLFIGVFMVTSGVAAITQGAGGAGFMAALLVCTLLLTFLTTLITTVIAFAVSWLTAHFPGQKLLGTLLYFAVFILIMVGAFQLNNVGTLLLQNQEAFDNLLSSWLLPFGLMKRGLAGDIAAVLLLAALSVLPFLAIVWLFSSQYKKVLSALSARTVRNDYKLGELKTSGQFMTLFHREVKRYFGTSIYFFNTGFGAVTLVVAAAFACFGYRAAIPYVEAFAPLVGGMEMVCGLAVLAIGFFSTTICTTCVSISLEGKTFWILKEAPVSPKTYFSSKIAVNLLVAWPSVLLCTVPLGIVYGVDPVTLAASVFVLLALGLLVALYGLAVNLLFPKMDAPNDTIVVKQSVSALIGALGGWVILAAAVGGYFLFGRLMPVAGYMAVWGVLFLVLSAAVWGWLLKGGAKRLRQLD